VEDYKRYMSYVDKETEWQIVTIRSTAKVNEDWQLYC
jgi:hypothetical protein